MNPQKISKTLKEVLAMVADALEKGGLMSIKRDDVLSEELVDFLNGTPNKEPELKKASKFQPDQFYLVLAKVDEVDEYNNCVHVSGCKPLHWFHFDNLYEAPGEKYKSVSTRRTIIKHQS